MPPLPRPAVTGDDSDGPPDEVVPGSIGDPFAEEGATSPVFALRFPWGQSVELCSGDTLELGRDPARAMAVHMTDNISSEHCRLEVRDEAVTVTDEFSTNGTFVDGKRIAPGVGVGALREIRLAADPPIIITIEMCS